MLAAGMFVSVGERQEREEYLVVPAEILGDHARAAVDVVENRAVMLHHPARRAAGAAGVDKAGEILAREIGLGGGGFRNGGLRSDQIVPGIGSEERRVGKEEGRTWR